MGRAIGWSALAVVSRQGAQMVSALVLARILGPDSYGAVSVAMIYVTLTMLVLDQGLSSALVQRPDLEPGTPGAVSTVNIAVSLVLGALTWLLAPAAADFFGTSELVGLLEALGALLVLKAVAITPRAMALREMRLRLVAVADIAGAVLGLVLGVGAAVAGAGVTAMVWQVVATDLAVAVVLVAASRGTAPNLRLRLLRAVLPFGIRIFLTNGIAFFSRNADNVLVGRFLGVTSLAYYAMAYRVLVIPVQMIGQTVNRVAFPAFSRMAHDPARVGRRLLDTTRLLAFAAVLPMLLAAVAAPEAVGVVLGAEWSATAPVLTVLAIAGARETVMYVSGPLMRAMGAARTNLRYEVLATAVQLTGIVVGLRWGIVGVALGYTIAGFLLTPVLLLIQRRLTGVAARSQLGSILPAVHAGAWGVVAYVGVRWAVDVPAIATLVVGSVAYLLVAAGVLLTFHRRALRAARRWRDEPRAASLDQPTGGARP